MRTSFWVIFTLMVFSLTSVSVLAQTTPTTTANTTGKECKDGPFENAQEAAKVKEENYECYLIRSKYGEGVQDGQSLQDINTAIQGIQTGLQFLQQLRSLTGQGSSGGNNPSSGGNNAVTPVAPFVDSYQQQPLEPQTRTPYESGLTPSLYFAPSEFIAPTSTTVSFGDGATTRTYRVADHVYTDLETGETFTWAQVLVREGLVPDPNDYRHDPNNYPVGTLNFNSNFPPHEAAETNSYPPGRRSFDLSGREIFAALVTRPDPATNHSHPLSPNLFNSFSNQMSGTVSLFKPAEQNVGDTPRELHFNIFAAGIFAPLQNFIVGLSNGITSLFSRR